MRMLVVNIQGGVAVAGLAFALGVAPTHAAYLYSYESSNFAFIQNSDAVPGSYTTNQHISASFLLAQALGPNVSLGLPTFRPIDFSLSDGRGTIGGSDPNVFLAFFTVTTDGSGNISQWEISAYDHLLLPTMVGEQTHQILTI